MAPLTTRLMEGKVAVTEVEDQAFAAQGIVPGTELEAIDGRPVLEYAKAEIEPYAFGFTPQDRAREICTSLNADVFSKKRTLVR